MFPIAVVWAMLVTFFSALLSHKVRSLHSGKAYPKTSPSFRQEAHDRRASPMTFRTSQQGALKSHSESLSRHGRGRIRGTLAEHQRNEPNRLHSKDCTIVEYTCADTETQAATFFRKVFWHVHYPFQALLQCILCNTYFTPTLGHAFHRRWAPVANAINAGGFQPLMPSVGRLVRVSIHQQGHCAALSIVFRCGVANKIAYKVSEVLRWHKKVSPFPYCFSH